MAYLQRPKPNGAQRWATYYRKRPGAKPTYYRTFATEAEAVEAVAFLEREFEKKPARLTAGPAVAMFDEFMAARQISEGTRDFYERKGRPFILHMGDRPPGEWLPRHMEEFLSRYEPATANGFIKTMRVFVRWALARKHKIADFARLVELRRTVKKERRVRTEEEYRLVMAQAVKENHYLRRPLIFARHGGLAIRDLYDLCAEHIDYANGVINHPRCKTGYGDPIVLTAPLLAALAEKPTVTGPILREMPGYEKRRDNGNLASLERRAGVKRTKGDGLHAYRHAGISAAYREGGLPAARRFAQHAPNSNMTYGYLHNETDADYRAAVERASARATGAS